MELPITVDVHTHTHKKDTVDAVDRTTLGMRYNGAVSHSTIRRL